MPPLSKAAKPIAKRFWAYVVIGVVAWAVAMTACSGSNDTVFQAAGKAANPIPLPSPASLAVVTPTQAVKEEPTPPLTVLKFPIFAIGKPMSYYYEHFDDPNTAIVDDGATSITDYRFHNGQYEMAVHAPGVLTWSMLDGVYGDVMVQMQMEVEGNGGTPIASGVILRHQDDENFYLVNVATNGFYNLELVKDGVHTELLSWTASDAIHTAQTPSPPHQAVRPFDLSGTLGHSGSSGLLPHMQRIRNTLLVEARGNALTIGINGSHIETTIESSFSYGKMALAVNTFHSCDTTVRFDNLAIVQARK
jgi:hypothetical protein